MSNALGSEETSTIWLPSSAGGADTLRTVAAILCTAPLAFLIRARTGSQNVAATFFLGAFVVAALVLMWLCRASIALRPDAIVVRANGWFGKGHALSASDLGGVKAVFSGTLVSLEIESARGHLRVGPWRDTSRNRSRVVAAAERIKVHLSGVSPAPR